MPWYRTPDGQGVYHACIRGRRGAPDICRAPRFEADSSAHGELCGRMGGTLCDGPHGPQSPSGETTCSRSICERHATHVNGQDRDYCPEHAHLAPKPS